MPEATAALALICADHRRLEQCFEEFQSTQSMWREEELAFQICAAIRRHVQIDEAVFYPALVRAVSVQYQIHAAAAEQAEMLELIDEIERAGPTEESFFAKMHVLCEMFRRHVALEERAGGIFSGATHHAVDWAALRQAIEYASAHEHTDG